MTAANGSWSPNGGGASLGGPARGPRSSVGPRRRRRAGGAGVSVSLARQLRFALAACHAQPIYMNTTCLGTAQKQNPRAHAMVNKCDKHAKTCVCVCPVASKKEDDLSCVSQGSATIAHATLALLVAIELLLVDGRQVALLRDAVEEIDAPH